MQIKVNDIRTINAFILSPVPNAIAVIQKRSMAFLFFFK